MRNKFREINSQFAFIIRFPGSQHHHKLPPFIKHNSLSCLLYFWKPNWPPAFPLLQKSYNFAIVHMISLQSHSLFNLLSSCCLISIITSVQQCWFMYEGNTEVDSEFFLLTKAYDLCYLQSIHENLFYTAVFND